MLGAAVDCSGFSSGAVPAVAGASARGTVGLAAVFGFGLGFGFAAGFSAGFAAAGLAAGSAASPSAPPVAKSTAKSAAKTRKTIGNSATRGPQLP